MMRGYMIALAHRSTTTGEASRSAPSSKMQFELQMLDYASGRQHRICRGVWSAELHNICDMLDAALIQLAFLEEVQHGPQSAARLRQLSEQGGFGTLLSAYTDSKSIWSYLKANHLKTPAEKGTFYHLAFVQETLNRWLSEFSWIDTRDMVADALTKGKLDRLPLQKFMQGHWQLEHQLATIAKGKDSQLGAPS